MPDNRTKNIRWRELVGLWLGSEYRVRVRQRPYLVRPSESLAEGFEPGHLTGLDDILLNVHAEREFLAGQQIDRAKADARLGGKELYFAVQYRQGRPTADALVFTDLETLGRLLQRLGLDT